MSYIVINAADAHAAHNKASEDSCHMSTSSVAAQALNTALPQAPVHTKIQPIPDIASHTPTPPFRTLQMHSLAKTFDFTACNVESSQAAPPNVWPPRCSI
eukprot:gnl/MRDRNA2_/MRDRNA2_42403_c0_seq1.p1 gnl/MRDRNA2_/MRDRNA2_42403_c0~~gnl/MRDRNA2_/MRDRNA2_42403_c0_seq1.p1  ORF type:complete len:117 (+),score=5.44 gnl/MRDRNA2_/MRDRNA2_42403_c0_seq1:52-351(+)